MKINDSIFLGTAAGIIGSIPSILFNLILFIDNLLFALTTAYLIVRWWGEKLESGTL